MHNTELIGIREKHISHMDVLCGGSVRKRENGHPEAQLLLFRVRSGE